MKVFVIALMGLGLSQASGNELWRRLAGARSDYYLNSEGIGSGRCEDGMEHMIYDEGECKYAAESLGYKVKTTFTVDAWSKVCGCSFNVETGHMQFNSFVHPSYCYTMQQSVKTQDFNSRQDGLIAICYNKPHFDPNAPTGVAPGNNYLNVAGVGSGRCEKGWYHQIRNVDDCINAVASLDFEVKTMFTTNAWGKVCGCSYNTETGHLQFNQFTHPEYCYTTQYGQHMKVQDLDSRQERLIAVCHNPVLENGSGEETGEPTMETTAEPTIEITAEPTMETTAEPTIEITAEPTIEITAEPTMETTAEPTVGCGSEDI